MLALGEILRNTSMSVLNANGMSGIKQSTTNYMKFILGYVCGLEVLESICVRRLFLSWIRIGHSHITHSFL